MIVSPILNKAQMTEEDIKLQFITPAITGRWPKSLITMETKITDGKINLKGNLVVREKPKKADYVLSYFHPSDFDPDQPQMPQLPKMRQLKNRVALKGAYKKFQRYIADYDFMSIKDADKVMEWNTCRTVSLEKKATK